MAKSGRVLGTAMFAASLVLTACSSGNKGGEASIPTVGPAIVSPSTTATATVRPSPTRLPTITIPSLFATPASGPGGTPAAGTVPQDLTRLALQASDLPPGFALTSSGPGGPELGQDVVSSYQEEFQQRQITSTQSLQQTVAIVDLLGRYRDATSAEKGFQAVNVQSLNQTLSAANLTSDPATIPAIGDDSAGYHFTGTLNGVSVGGYVIIFHVGPTTSMIITASVKGSESLPQTISLAQTQASKLKAG